MGAIGVSIIRVVRNQSPLVDDEGADKSGIERVPRRYLNQKPSVPGWNQIGSNATMECALGTVECALGTDVRHIGD